MGRRSAKQKGTTAEGPKAADRPSKKMLNYETTSSDWRITMIVENGWERLIDTGKYTLT
jgi:hypothetical protein